MSGSNKYSNHKIKTIHKQAPVRFPSLNTYFHHTIHDEYPTCITKSQMILINWCFFFCMDSWTLMFLGNTHNCRNWINLGFDWTIKPVTSSLNSKYFQDQISQIFHFLQFTIITKSDTSIKGSSTRKKQPPLSSNKLPGYTYQRETQDWSTKPPPLQKPTQTWSRIGSYFKCYKSTSILQIETSSSTYKNSIKQP